MGRVVVLGSLNVDLVTRVERHPSPGETVLGEGLQRLAGGKGANQAVAAAQAGASVVMVGSVGDDEGGSAYLTRLKSRGVDVSRVVVHPEEPTGTALIVVDGSGENSIVVVAGANGTVTWDFELDADDVLLAQLEVPLDTVADAIRAAASVGARVVLNVAPYADLPADVLDLCDPVVANEHEASQLTATPTSLLVTRGAAGATWGDLEVPAESIAEDEVVDTTGAGDAFCGALAAALAAGKDDELALRAAVAAGGAAVRHQGAQPDPGLDPGRTV
jgi:ribokinase